MSRHCFGKIFGQEGLCPLPKILSALCLFGAGAGFMLCLFQSPQNRAEKLAQAGHSYFQQTQAEDLQSASEGYLLSLARNTLLRSVRLNASDVRSWRALAEIFEREGRFDAARQAEEIAAHLSGQGPEDKPHSDIRLARARVFSF